METSAGIDLSLINDGDEVILMDEHGNKARGIAHPESRTSQPTLYVLIFGSRVEFARLTARGWQRSGRITVIGHQPTIDFE